LFQAYFVFKKRKKKELVPKKQGTPQEKLQIFHME
jgi:hypothetical protein